MLVSIIIPVYNVEKFIEECLESVYQQTYPYIEVILVNDCTPDGSMVIANAIINKYKSKYSTTIINHSQNKGLAEARNSGIKAAKGEYIYFIDSDDAIIPDTIKLLAEVAIKYNNVEIIEADHFIGADFKLTNNNQEPIPPIIYRGDDSKIQFLIKDNKPFVWNILYKKTFITTHSLAFQSELIYEDLHFRLQVIPNLSSMALLPINTYFYRFNNSSLSNKATKKHLLSINTLLIYITEKVSKESSTQKLYLTCFCKHAFFYWNQPCRALDEHKEYLGTIRTTVSNIISKYYKLLNFNNLVLLLPFYIPYRVSIYYVKIIWKYFKYLN